MAELTIIGGPTPPKGETLHERTMAVFTVYGGYADGLKVFPQTHVAVYDLTTAGWKPRGSPNGTPMTIPGAVTGEPKPPLTEITETQVYVSGRESQTTTRKQLIIATNEVGTEWNYAAPPLDIQVVAPHDANYYQFLQNELSSTIAGVQGATQDAQTAAQNANDAATEAYQAAAAAWSGGGAEVSDLRLLEWVAAGAVQPINITPADNGAIQTATIRWPDHTSGTPSQGTYTGTNWNAAVGDFDGGEWTHPLSGLKVVQPPVNRNAQGILAGAQPALTIAQI